MKLSIIIPVYNAEKYLITCIDSILKQDFSDYELLLIDDGSTDNSGAICDEYVSKNANIKVFHLKNGGPSAARNYGIQVAQGEYIQFVDADDIVKDNYADVFSEITSEFQPDLIIGEAEIVDENDVLKRKLYLDRQGLHTPEDLLDKMDVLAKEEYLHYIWNKWYRTEAIRNAKLLFNDNVQLGEDFLFNCAFFQNINKIYLSNTVMYWYYIRNVQSLTSKFRENEIERRRMMDSTFINLLKSKDVYETNKVAFNAQIGSIALQSILSISKSACKLSIKEKRKFISGFLNSEYYEYLMAYKNKVERPMEKVVLTLAKVKSSSGIELVSRLKRKR